MKFCQRHWDTLRGKIDEAGLTSYISKDGAAAAQSMIEEDVFEPLMGAHNAIMYNALKTIGLEIMIGERCPICFGNESIEQHVIDDPDCKGNHEPFDCWLDYAVHDQLEEAQKRGLPTMKSSK